VITYPPISYNRVFHDCPKLFHHYFAVFWTDTLHHLGQPFSTAQYQRTILFRNSSPIIQGQNSMNKDTEAKQNKYKENGKAKTGCLKNGTA
jgi:hypothetical protein